MLSAAVYILAALGGLCLLSFAVLAVLFTVAINHEDRHEHRVLRESWVSRTAWYGPIVSQPIPAARREHPISLLEFSAADQSVLREVGERLYPEHGA